MRLVKEISPRMMQDQVIEHIRKQGYSFGIWPPAWRSRRIIPGLARVYCGFNEMRWTVPTDPFFPAGLTLVLVLVAAPHLGI